MANTNGATPSPRRVYHAVPKTLLIPIEVERAGRTEVVEFVGYHRDCPEVWVQIEVQAAWDEWTSASYVENAERVEVPDPVTGELTVPDQVYRRNPHAEAMLRRDILMAVIRGLEQRDADILARDGGEWLPILSDLGWWSTVLDEQAPDRPEVEGGETRIAEPPGDVSSPELAPAMALTTG